MTIRIAVEGASDDEIRRGLAAAQAVFDRAGVTAAEAAKARFITEAWDDYGFPDPQPEAELEICDVWDDADEAALNACCAGWPEDRKPSSAELGLLKVPPEVRVDVERRWIEWMDGTRFQDPSPQAAAR